MSDFSWTARIHPCVRGGCCELEGEWVGGRRAGIAEELGARGLAGSEPNFLAPRPRASLGFSQGSDSCLIINMRLYNFDINIKTSAGLRDMRRRKPKSYSRVMCARFKMTSSSLVSLSTSSRPLLCAAYPPIFL